MDKTGTITINAENIMPVIKKWLYSDKDIFMREIISNACDAIAKYKMLALKGDVAEASDYRVDVVLDEAAGTIAISDNGVGMTADEVTRYIAQVAFSGATDFLAKYKPDDKTSGIIGHFGLGFYSAFMVSDNVTIDTLSWEPGAEAVRWTSDDGMQYEMEPSARTERGTTVTLKLTEEDHEFLHLYEARNVIEKYCAFMPVPIYLTEVKPEKAETETAPDADTNTADAQSEEAPEEKAPEQINDVLPLWMKRPADVTDEEYKEFYHKVFHDYDEPLFWIHLNAEYPFNLKGILYFPKIRNEFSSSEGVIKLYNNQVFVADNIKEVIPEFLMLLKGAIDCPDLPLNVSRSFLQNDGYVKKMSAYITRKVADRLVSEFTTKREDYQKYWDDIHPFVKYGCIKDEKFYDRVKEALIFKTVDGGYMTIPEYVEKNCADQDEKTLYYASDEKRQAQMIDLYRQEGKDVLLLHTLIDNNFISMLEYNAPVKDMKLKFLRVDAGMQGLTEDGATDETNRLKLEEKFRAALDQKDLEVKLMPFKQDTLPAMITVEEQTRRFTEMSQMWGGKGFSMPEKRTLVLNEKHPLVKHLEASDDKALDDMLCCQIEDLAEMARNPLESARMIAFLKRSNDLLTRLVEKS